MFSLRSSRFIILFTDIESHTPKRSVLILCKRTDVLSYRSITKGRSVPFGVITKFKSSESVNKFEPVVLQNCPLCGREHTAVFKIMEGHDDHEEKKYAHLIEEGKKRVRDAETLNEGSLPCTKRIKDEKKDEDTENSEKEQLGLSNVSVKTEFEIKQEPSGMEDGLISLTSMSDSIESLQESFQSSEQFSAEEFSMSLNETECESLESSVVKLENKYEDFPLPPKPKEEDSGFKSTSGTIHKQKEKKKRKSKKHKSFEEETPGNKNATQLRPNYFVGVQISNSDIHNALIKVQEDLVAFDPGLCKALVDVATSHLTLLIARIDDEDALSLACSALDECYKNIEHDITASPIQLTFSGLDHFSHNVLYAQVVKNEHYQRLLKLSETLRQCFSDKGVVLPNVKPLNLHLTIAKMSKAPRGRGKSGPRKIEPSSYDVHKNMEFGCQTVKSLQLLAMNKPKDEKRYYICPKVVKFGIDVKENPDHSKCCFPRRPVVLSPHRSFSTKETGDQSSISEDQSSISGDQSSISGDQSSILGSTIGFATALAASLMILFVIGKVSRKF